MNLNKIYPFWFGYPKITVLQLVHYAVQNWLSLTNFITSDFAETNFRVPTLPNASCPHPGPARERAPPSGS